MKPKEFIPLRSTPGLSNLLSYVKTIDDVYVYEAKSDLPMQMSYRSPDDIVALDMDGLGWPITPGWKTNGMELIKISGFNPCYLYFKKIDNNETTNTGN